MDHRKVTVTFMTGEAKDIVIDRIDGMRIRDGIAYFGRTDSARWRELMAAPLASVRDWANA